MCKQSMGMGYIIALHVRVLATFAPPIEAAWYLLLACGVRCDRLNNQGFELPDTSSRYRGGKRARVLCALLACHWHFLSWSVLPSRWRRLSSSAWTAAMCACGGAMAAASASMMARPHDLGPRAPFLPQGTEEPF
jgi:hypothetical protein